MIAVGLRGGRRCSRCPGCWPAIGVVAADPAAAAARLLRRRARALAAASLARRASTWTGWRTTSPRRRCRSRSAIRADGGWDSLGGWTTLGLLIAVLVLLVRVESRARLRRARRGGAAGGRGHRGGGRAARRRAARGCGGRCGFAPFFRAFVAIEFSLPGAAGGDLGRGRRATSTGTRALVDRARAGGRADRGRAAGGDPGLAAAAMTFGCVVLTQGRRPAELRAALESLLAQQRRRGRRRGRRQRLGARRGCPTACGAVALGRTSASRAGATPACPRCAASCCSSSTTTRGWRATTRWRGSRAAR